MDIHTVRLVIRLARYSVYFSVVIHFTPTMSLRRSPNLFPVIRFDFLLCYYKITQ